jgi:hypothetical protein
MVETQMHPLLVVEGVLVVSVELVQHPLLVLEALV